jgi:hypothetical protein
MYGILVVPVDRLVTALRHVPVVAVVVRRVLI